jgi:hypothetical protein
MNERKKKPYEQNKRTKSFGRKKNKKNATLQKKSKKDKKKMEQNTDKCVAS